MTTIAEIKLLAHYAKRSAPENSDGERLGFAIEELLEADLPCGWPAPEATVIQQTLENQRGEPGVTWEPLGRGVHALTADEVRGLVAALLRALGEAEELCR